MGVDQIATYLVDQGFVSQTSDNFMRVLFFLHRESNEWNGDTPVRNFLLSLINTNNHSMIRCYVENIIEDTLKASRDEEYSKIIHDLYAGFCHVEESGRLSRQWYKKLIEYTEKKLSPRNPETYVRLVSQVAFSLNTVPEESLPTLVRTLEETNNAAGTLSLGAGQQDITVTLMAVHLSWEAISNIWKWYRGEISGKRCAKSVVDSIATVTAGLGGCFAGAAALGAVAGPAGAFGGAIAGSLMGSNMVAVLMNSLTNWIFDLPKTARLEKAYSFMDLHHTATNDKINSTYRRLALKYHPDKPGGSNNMWLKLQVSMEVIKADRMNG